MVGFAWVSLVGLVGRLEGLASLVGVGNCDDGIHFHLPLCFLAPWSVASRMDLQKGSIWIRNLGCLRGRHVID